MENDEIMFIELIAKPLIKELKALIASNRKKRVLTKDVIVRRGIFKCLRKLKDKSELNGINKKHVSFFI